MLIPILSFTTSSEWTGDELEQVEMEKTQQAIAPSVRAIHAYWLARREEFITAATPVRHTESRVGRNEPCPCGSGKMYKKCCLH